MSSCGIEQEKSRQKQTNDSSTRLSCLLDIQLPKNENIRLDFAPSVADGAGDLEARVRCSLRRLFSELEPREQLTIKMELRVDELGSSSKNNANSRRAALPKADAQKLKPSKSKTNQKASCANKPPASCPHRLYFTKEREIYERLALEACEELDMATDTENSRSGSRLRKSRPARPSRASRSSHTTRSSRTTRTS